jgi:hypothetical protein
MRRNKANEESEIRRLMVGLARALQAKNIDPIVSAHPCQGGINLKITNQGEER